MHANSAIIFGMTTGGLQLAAEWGGFCERIVWLSWICDGRLLMQQGQAEKMRTHRLEIE